MKFRIAMDTNVLFSALNFGGKPGKILELIVHKQADMSISEYMQNEYVDVCERKEVSKESFLKLLTLDNVRQVLDDDYATEKNIAEARNNCRDPKDVAILAFAIHGFEHNWLDYLISGDPDLLTPEIARLTKNRILRPAEFLEFHENKKD